MQEAQNKTWLFVLDMMEIKLDAVGLDRCGGLSWLIF